MVYAANKWTRADCWLYHTDVWGKKQYSNKTGEHISGIWQAHTSSRSTGEIGLMKLIFHKSVQYGPLPTFWLSQHPQSSMAVRIIHTFTQVQTEDRKSASLREEPHLRTWVRLACGSEIDAFFISSTYVSAQVNPFRVKKKSGTCVAKFVSCSTSIKFPRTNVCSCTTTCAHEFWQDLPHAVLAEVTFCTKHCLVFAVGWAVKSPQEGPLISDGRSGFEKCTVS